MAAPDDARDARATPIARVASAEVNGIFTVTVVGELDVSNVSQLRESAERMPNEALGLVVDLAAATFIDSATVGVLFALRESLARRGQLLTVLATEGSAPDRVLELTGFDTRARTQGSVAEAVAAIRRELSAS